MESPAGRVAEIASRFRSFFNGRQEGASRLQLDDADVDLLIQALKDSGTNVRREAAWALRCAKEVRAVKPFLEYVHNPENVNRGSVVWALGSMGDESVVGPLIEMVRDPDGSIRSAAMCSLARRGEASAVEPLLTAFQRVLSHEEDAPQVRWETVMWMRLLSERLNDKAAFVSVREALETLKADDDPFMRREVSRTLEWLKAPV